MAVVLSWLRLDLRRRWKSLVVLALLIALASGTVLSAFAGARRGASAMDRLVAATHPADAAVVANSPGFDWEPIRKLPEVESLSLFLLQDSGFIKGGTRDLGVDFVHPVGDPLYRQFEKPVVLEGRMYDASATDEAVASGDALQRLHKKVGDSLTVRLESPEQIGEGGVPDDAKYSDFRGPTLNLRIVGLVVSPWLTSPDGTGGIAYPPAVYAKYPKSFLGPTGKPSVAGPDGSPGTVFNSLVKLKGGEADLAAFTRDFQKASGRSDIDIWNLNQQNRDHAKPATLDAKSLTAFALAALLASLFLVGQAVGRFAAGTAAELDTARALGMTPRQRILASVAAPAVAGGLGALVAVVAAGIASRWFPIYAARWFEPDPGLRIDRLVLSLGLVATPLLAVGAAALSAWQATRATTGDVALTSSPVANAAAAANLPVPAQVGTRFALETGRGRTAVPVRPAIVGAIVGVVGTIAVCVFAAGISDAARTPQRFGMTYQVGSFFGANGQDFLPAQQIYQALTDSKDVSGITDAKTDVVKSDNAKASAQLWQHTEGKKPLKTVLLKGRMPRTGQEMVLTPGTLDDFHARVGQTITVDNPKGAPVPMKIVGSGFVPRGPHNSYNQGGWVNEAGYAHLFGTGFKFHLVFIASDLPAATAATKINAELAAALPQIKGYLPVVSDMNGSGLGTESETHQLKNVEKLPIFLAGFLGLLAIGTVGHALASAVRKRSSDIAVFRALGLTPGQSRGIVATQATVLALVGLLFGIPLGFAIGRTVWRGLADFIPLAYVPPTALAAFVVVIATALIVAYAVAAWPAIRASRLKVAAILRAE